jgi:Queuosine biosynthesis protein QueC
MGETVILCGGAKVPRGARKPLLLSVTGKLANVRLRSEDIGRRMLTSLPSRLADLLDLATYVFCADRLVSRGGKTGRRLGADWRRDLRFVIPVREPDRWSSPEVSGSLEHLLAFMSDDRMRFEFVSGDFPASSSDYFDFDSEVDEVTLFSGGLDSLTGSIDRLSNGGARLLLVSHQSSTKIATRQRELAHELTARFPRRVIHIPVRVTMQGVEAIETTQRTRSFLFGALGAAVTEVAGTTRLSLCENGIVSLNLPIAGQVVGTAATRTTHPRVMRDMSDFLSTLLDKQVSVENPYLWKTKAEVVARLKDLGHADLARHTVSCSRVHWMTRLHTHCGRCSQCLDRRFAALASGLGEDDPAEMYETDLLTGARDDDLDKTMAESFVRHALELGDLTDRSLASRFGGELGRTVSCVRGMSADDAARAFLDLHHRHGAAVRSVLEDGYRKYASDLAGQTLPASCILRLVAGPGGISMPEAAQPNAPGVTPADDRDYTRSSQIRLALDASQNRVLVEGVPPIEGRAAFALLQALVEQHQRDQGNGLAPENYTFLNAKRLADKLGISDTSLRRCIYRVRQRLADAFETCAGLPLSADALVENKKWKGYRLNHAVLILAPEELSAS